MSWLEPPSVDRLPWHVRTLVWILGRRGGPSEAVRQWARAPRALLGFLHLYKALDRTSSPLDPALRALVMARVSQVNRCAFCVDLNAARALERGTTAAQLDALADHASSPLFGPREKAALAFADAVAAPGAAVPPEVRLRVRAFFSEDAIVELTALVALQDLSSRFNAALDVPAEGYCQAASGARRTAAPRDG